MGLAGGKRAENIQDIAWEKGNEYINMLITTWTHRCTAQTLETSAGSEKSQYFNNAKKRVILRAIYLLTKLLTLF